MVDPAIQVRPPFACGPILDTTVIKPTLDGEVIKHQRQGLGELLIGQLPPRRDVRGPGPWLEVRPRLDSEWPNGPMDTALLVEQVAVSHAGQEQEAVGEDARSLNQKPDWLSWHRRYGFERDVDRQVLGGDQRNVGLVQPVSVGCHRWHALCLNNGPEVPDHLIAFAVGPQHDAPAHRRKIAHNGLRGRAKRATQPFNPASLPVGYLPTEELDQFATPLPYLGHSRHPRLAVPLPQIAEHGLDGQHVGEAVGGTN